MERETLGLFEIDGNNKVLYCSIENINGSLDLEERDQSGQNFFEQVVAFSNIEDLRRKLDFFKADTAPARSFEFVCQYPWGPVPVRILLARLGKQFDERPASFLIHIKRSEAMVAHA